MSLFDLASRNTLKSGDTAAAVVVGIITSIYYAHFQPNEYLVVAADL
jgi:hypothetical protein